MNKGQTSYTKMKRGWKKVDSAYFQDKVALRLGGLPKKKSIRVLDAFGGEGRIWDEVKRRSGKTITVVKLDLDPDKSGIYLKGDNEKFLRSMNLSKFDVIDLDAYGIPYKQMAAVFDYAENHKLNTTVFVTAAQIQRNASGIPWGMMYELGYTRPMLEKVPTLFYRNLMDRMAEYLGLHGVESMTHRGTHKINYFYFCIRSPKKSKKK